MHGLTVMIIDDSSVDRYALKRHLNKMELSLVIAEVSSGAEGLKLLTTPTDELEATYPGISAPITLFLDINMPAMNGWEFLDALERQHHDIKLTPMVIMMFSSSNRTDDRSKSMHYKSVVDYIVKGESTPDSLKEKILSNQKAA